VVDCYGIGMRDVLQDSIVNIKQEAKLSLG